MPQSNFDRVNQTEQVRTYLTAPSTALTPQQPVDQRDSIQQFRGGLKAFGAALSQAGDTAKKRRILQDVRTAENAALREEALPGSLLPVAVDAYNKTLDKNAVNSINEEYETIRNGQDYVNLINNPNVTTDEKNDNVDNEALEIYSRASQYITDPDALFSLQKKLSAGTIEDKKLILEAEANQRNLVMIKRIQGEIEDKNILNAKNHIYKGTDFESAESKFDSKWVNHMASELGEFNTYIPEHLRKLLVFKVLARSQHGIENPKIITNLLSEEYAPGFTYGNLLVADGDDATEFLAVYTKWVTESNAYATKKEAEEVKARKTHISQLGSSLIAGNDTDAVRNHPELDEFQKNKIINAIHVARANLEEDTELKVDSPEVLSLIRKIQKGKFKNFSAADMDFHGKLHNFSTGTIEVLQKYIGEEAEQLKNNDTELVDRVSTIDANLQSLGNSLLFQDSDFHEILKKAGETGMTNELKERLFMKSVPVEFKARLVTQIHRFRIAMEKERNKLAQRAANNEWNRSGTIPEKEIHNYAQKWEKALFNLGEGIRKDPAFLPLTMPKEDKEKLQAKIKENKIKKEEAEVAAEAARKAKQKAEDKTREENRRKGLSPYDKFKEFFTGAPEKTSYLGANQYNLEYVKQEDGMSFVRAVRVKGKPEEKLEGIHNNPGNIEKGQGYAGETGGTYANDRDRPFVDFDTPQMGLRSMMRDMMTKIDRHKGNISKIITQYAPPSENDTKSYIKHIKKSLGGKDVVDKTKLIPLVKAIITMENKPEVADYYLNDPKIIEEAFALSQQSFPSGTSYKDAMKTLAKGQVI